MWFQVEPHEREPLDIVGDGAALNKDVTGGGFVPAVVFDAQQRPDLVELIQDHQSGATGEVESMWGKLKPDDPEEWSLILRFEVPRTALAIIEFSADANGLLVDMIMRTQRLLLFPGESGDVPSKCMQEGRPSMMIEVVATTDEWQLRWTDAICRKHNVPADIAREIQERMREAFGGQYLE